MPPNLPASEARRRWRQRRQSHSSTGPSCASDHPRLVERALGERDGHPTMVREHDAIENIHDPHNRNVGTFDPGHEKVRNLLRRGDSAIAQKLDDQLPDQSVVRRRDLDLRSRREARSKVRELDLPLRRRAVGEDQQRPAQLLGLIPGVEERFLLMILGIVEQAPSGLADKDPAKQASAGLSRARHQGGHDRPQRPAGQVLEDGAVGVGKEEILLLVGHRPGERKRDLVHPGRLPAQREILKLLPLAWTCQPCAWSAAWSAAESPTNVTRIVELPPSARLVVIAEVTPLTRLTDISACCTAAASGVGTWMLKVVVCPAGTCWSMSSATCSVSSTGKGGSGGWRMTRLGSGRRRPLSRAWV